jgi:aconitase A
MNAHKIVNGQPIDYTVKDKDFFFFQRLEYHGLQELVVSLCKERLPKAYGLSPMTDIQVISPTRQGPAGTVELNKIMQQQLNPRAAGKSEIKTPVYTYRAGDKVMQTKNNYHIPWTVKNDKGVIVDSGEGIYNGDTGMIKAIYPEIKEVMPVIKEKFPEATRINTGFGSTIYAVKPGDGSAREQAASCQKVLGGWANIAKEYATKRYRSNIINWGMLPFILDEDATENYGDANPLSFENGDYVFIPDVKKMVSEKLPSCKAYAVKADGTVNEFELSTGDLTDDERKIILAGCLINFYRN